MARTAYNDVETAFYEKGVARVAIMSTVDDTRKSFGTLMAAPPGTPMDDFLKEHEEEIKERMEKTQMMIAEGVRTVGAPNLTMQDKFEKLRENFEATKPSQEEIEQDINDLTKKTSPETNPELPKPRVPVYELITTEAAIYMQEVMDFIMKYKLGVKRSVFRKWPQVSTCTCTCTCTCNCTCTCRS